MSYSASPPASTVCAKQWLGCVNRTMRYIAAIAKPAGKKGMKVHQTCGTACMRRYPQQSGEWHRYRSMYELRKPILMYATGPVSILSTNTPPGPHPVCSPVCSPQLLESSSCNPATYFLLRHFFVEVGLPWHIPTSFLWQRWAERLTHRKLIGDTQFTQMIVLLDNLVLPSRFSL